MNISFKTKTYSHCLHQQSNVSKRGCKLTQWRRGDSSVSKRENKKIWLYRTGILCRQLHFNLSHNIYLSILRLCTLSLENQNILMKGYWKGSNSLVGSNKKNNCFCIPISLKFLHPNEMLWWVFLLNIGLFHLKTIHPL